MLPMLRMIRSCALLLAFFAACLSFPATAKPPLPDERAMETALVQQAAAPAMWKVSDEDTTIYIFGTIHILPEGVDWLNGKVAEAFADSDELVTEIVGGDPLTMQALVLDKAILTDGTGLRDLLTNEERTAYEAALTGFGVPAATFDRFEPWYAAIGLSTLPLLREGFKNDHGVERILEIHATERQMAHHGLETPEYQLGLFDSLPLDVQKRYLAEIVRQLPDIGTTLNAMVEAWKRGNAEELARLMNEEESDPVLFETLLVNRNRDWANWIAERLDEPGTVFLAVGAGHLAGSRSLQAQLAASGIASERVQ